MGLLTLSMEELMTRQTAAEFVHTSVWFSHSEDEKLFHYSITAAAKPKRVSIVLLLQYYCDLASTFCKKAMKILHKRTIKGSEDGQVVNNE